jgi:hypothetical protein
VAITAEITFDWSTPDGVYTDIRFDYLGGDVLVILGGLRPSGSGNSRKVIFNEPLDPGKDPVAYISPAEDGVLWNDFIGPALLNAAGEGYWLRLHGNVGQIYIMDAGGGGGSALAASFSIPAPLAADVYSLTIDGAGLLTASLDGSPQSTHTDTTYTGLAPAAVCKDENNALRGMSEFGADGLMTGSLAITGVNGDNTITSLGPIVIACVLGNSVTDVTLEGVALTITEQNDSSIECSPVDLHSMPIPPGGTRDLVITDGATSPSQSVVMLSEVGREYVVTTSILAGGLLDTVTQTAVVGDGYEGDTTSNLGLSALVYDPAGPHRNIDPAVPNGTINTGWFFDVSLSAWEEITETTNRASGALAPNWRAAPTPTTAIVGMPYNYCFGFLCDGDRPMTYTPETGEYPPGLSIDAATECFVGTPTAEGEYAGTSLKAENAVGSQISPLFVIPVAPIMLANVAASNILQTTANINVDSTSGGGTLYAAISDVQPYTQADALLIQNGPAVWRGNVVPVSGANMLPASGLGDARKQYIGVVQEFGTSISVIATGEFNTLAYNPGAKLPVQPVPYPDLVSYVGIPVHHDLMYGWDAEAPKTLTADRLPPGLSVTDAGECTGSPFVAGSTGVTTTVTNQYGTGQGSFSWKIYTLQPSPVTGMTRKTLVDAAIAYSDRYTDIEMSANMGSMIIFAEHRMSRIMRNREMSARALIPLIPNEQWQDLPADFDGMREVSIIPEGGTKTVLDAITPQQATQREASGSGRYYVIQANQLRLVGEYEGDVEITYYKRIPALVNDDDTNWVLQSNADIYQIAIQAQISLFAKDWAAATGLDEQLVGYFAEIELRDQKDRFSGGPISNRTDF